MSFLSGFRIRFSKDARLLNIFLSDGSQHQYKNLQIGSSAVVNISNKADCFVIIKYSEIIKVVNIIHSSFTNKTQILGHRFNDKQPLYLKPLKLSILDLSNNMVYASLELWLPCLLMEPALGGS